MVRASASFSARPEWYDRNPVTVTLVYVGTNITPHGSTSRGSYTVPAGKKALISHIYIELLRSAAATTIGKAYALVQTAAFNLALVGHIKNSVGDREWAARGGSGLLVAGDVIQIFTADGSTGGTMDYNVIAELTRFDA